ncbi:MAG: nucleotidyltransferase domain-containing protein [Chloroflexota bacterium]|nr:nucleotidyltransferase domain-containing protein [Chloroflexota bacterium]
MGIEKIVRSTPHKQRSGPDTHVADAPASLADALFTTTQQRVLGLLFGQPQQTFTVTELIAATGAGSGAAQREVAKLVDSGLVTMQPVGNQKHYQANPYAPVFEELVGIIQKTVGMAEPLRAALAPLADRIDAAFVYGSVAKRSDTASSDIDLMIVSDTLSYADVVGALHPLIERMGREINPTLYTRVELDKRIKDGNAFVTRVLAQPKVWIFGGDDVLRA